jgi:hypothetical protein
MRDYRDGNRPADAEELNKWLKMVFYKYVRCDYNMPMRKVDWDRVERELDPKYVTEDGVIVTPENYSKLVELGLIQDDKEREKAIRYNKRLLLILTLAIRGQHGVVNLLHRYLLG